MSAPDAAAAIIAVAVVVVAVGMLVVLRSAARALAKLDKAVTDLHRAAVPLLNDAHVTIQRAAGDLERVDALLTTAESIAGTVDGASRLAHSAVASPVVKVMATSAGMARAWRRFRHK